MGSFFGLTLHIHPIAQTFKPVYNKIKPVKILNLLQENNQAKVPPIWAFGNH